MKSDPRSLTLAEFIKIFRDRYVYKDANGATLIAMTSNEGLLLSKYLYQGIADCAVEVGDETGGLPDLEESLERYAERNIKEINLKLVATDEELLSLGTFLMRGVAAVFLTLEGAHAHERTYCC
jgi:hypothetical protein